MSAGAPRVSFVIPTRNHARFIRRAIDSCLAQEVPGAEILVVDGASTDGTREILASYGDRIAWTSERDAGQADAVNKGIARARGDIVAWLNSDDYYASPSALSTVLAAFAEDGRRDVVYGEGMTVDEAGQPLRPYGTGAWSSPKDGLVFPYSICLQPATFFRRALFLEIGGLRADLHYALDYELWMRMFPRARAVFYLRETLACATYHADAKSVAGMVKQIRETVAVKREYQRTIPLGVADRVRLEAGIASLWAYWAAVRVGLKRVA
jgi:glycosyltransferase involved in cell wall biosynthesis